jgi:hypothetical protein
VERARLWPRQRRLLQRRELPASRRLHGIESELRHDRRDVRLHRAVLRPALLLRRRAGQPDLRQLVGLLAMLPPGPMLHRRKPRGPLHLIRH